MGEDFLTRNREGDKSTHERGGRRERRERRVRRGESKVKAR
jgi:hypothetical protein